MQFSGDERSFDRYALPLYGILPQASQANKLTVVAGQLLYKSTPVQTLNITECLKEFIDFLKASKSRVVLAAHNGRVFDSRILVKALFKDNLLDAFQSVVMGFVDTTIIQEVIARQAVLQTGESGEGLLEQKL